MEQTQRIGVIGGSGLGQQLLMPGDGQAVDIQTPFGPPAAAPILANWKGIPVAILARHGAGHILNPTQVPYRANIYALKMLGCRWILASGAVGSLNENLHPRQLVLVDQAIDRTVQRVSTFFDQAAVHVDFSEPVCEKLRNLVYESRTELATDVVIHPRGTYVCMEGPAFSTRAESRLHRSWGGDLIGMTLMPEAKLAREAEISYASIALVTDYDAWKPHLQGQTSMELMREILSHLQTASENALHLIRAALARIWEARNQDFPAHRALELALFTDKAKITPEARWRLEALWGKYFRGRDS
ncbi:MAG: S-methyl-5'-thioadenosine phosphorylase [Phycisphaerae bacterium]